MVPKSVAKSLLNRRGLGCSLCVVSCAPRQRTLSPGGEIETQGLKTPTVEVVRFKSTRAPIKYSIKQ